jgi:hypothetical protein
MSEACSHGAVSRQIVRQDIEQEMSDPERSKLQQL